MWISKQTGEKQSAADGAELGTVTLSDGALAVYAGSERRNVTLVSPGGVFWRPAVGETVLLLPLADSTGACAAGAACALNTELEPGELLLKSGGASILLRNDGTIEVTGTVICQEAET